MDGIASSQETPSLDDLRAEAVRNILSCTSTDILMNGISLAKYEVLVGFQHIHVQILYARRHKFLSWPLLSILSLV
ncbi:hypothetical protein LIER_17532 [Lithospermum erythrorhizon]|uniref:Uncharacterized protein n=1 Tax=Lithospermum erythrorhizon TaxID=34254 RepID=A0AAV3QC06_LITER